MAWPLLIPLLLLALGIHALPHPGFGFHRDELLYFAMGDHLDLFRMQFPPLIAAAARASRLAFGDSVAGARFLPALAHATLMLLAAALARAMDGTGRAQLLAALGVMVAPVFVRGGTLFQPVIYEMVWWSLALLALAELLSRPAGPAGRDSWWAVLGLALGLGALTKFSIAFLVLGIAVAVMLSPLRAELRTRRPWIAALLAGAMALPSITGQQAWGWPFLTQMASLKDAQLDRVSPAGFLLAQPMMLGPAAVLMLAGAWSLTVGMLSSRFRPLAYAAGVVLVILLLLHGKDYYLAPVHPLLIAAGSVALVRSSERRAWRWPVPALAAFLLAGGALLLPLGAPVLPREELARHATRLGITHSTNRGTVLPLPQDFADMTGWEALATSVAAVYHSMPAAEQARTAIVGGNYGRAGALALFSRRLAMPYPISRSGDFYNWGLPGHPVDNLVVAGGSTSELQPVCTSVVEAARVANPWGVEEEQDVPIIICRGLRRPLPELWKALGPEWG